MILSRRSVSLAVIVSGGLLFQSFPLTNQLNPFFVSPSVMQKQRQALRQPSRTYTLAKRLAPGSASVSGTVTLLDSLASRPGVIIVDTFGYQVAQAQTDSAGAFSASGLFPGSYLLYAVTNGYSMFYFGSGSDRTYLGNTTNLNAAQWIHLSAGQTLTNQNITVAAASKKGVVISGTCYIGPGIAVPAANSYIRFKFVSADQAAGMLAYYQSVNGYCSTLADGTFRCTTDVTPGNYYILVQSDTYAKQWWNGSAISSEPVAAAIPNTVTGKFIHFDTGGSISGSIKDNGADSLLASVDVYLIDKDGFVIDQRFVSSGYTNFLFSGISPGSYFLKADDYTGTYVTTYYPQALFRDSAIALPVTSGSQTNNIILSLKRNPGYSVPATGQKGLIKGTITRADNGAAIPGVEVGAYSGSGMPFSSVTTNALGVYEDSVAADSSLLVYAGSSMFQMYNTVPDYFLAQTWYPGTTDRAAATSIKVGAQATLTINLSVQQGGSLAGLLRTSKNAGFPSYYQAIFGSGTVIFGYAWTDDFKNIYGTGSTDLSGFRFAGVNPGTYTVRFLSYGYDYSNMATSETDYGFASAKNVIVTKENTAFGQTIVLPDASARITGAVAWVPQSQSTVAYATHEFCCYGTDSIIAGITELSSADKGTSLKVLFFSMDNSPLTSQPAQSNYSLGKLVPGSYALAHLDLSSNGTVVTREWYGTKKMDTLNVSNYNLYLKQFMKPNIPSTTWLTLGAGETKANINFGNVGVVVAPGPCFSQKPALRVLNNHVQKKSLLHYRLSSPDLKSHGTLTIFRSNGARVRTFSLTKPEGVIVWDRHDDRNAPVTAGIYMFRLAGDRYTLSVKGVVSK
jgi:hypothetical protein